MSLLSRIEDERDRLRGKREKAISHRPDLANRVHVLQQWSDQTVAAELNDYADYANVYGVYVWVHKAISKIAEALAPLPVRVVDGEDKALDGHPLTLLLQAGNDSTSPADLWQSWVIHMLLGGESFFELVDDSRGRPVELWPRRPDEVKVRPDRAPERVLYPRVAGYVYGDGDDLIEPENMWHSRFYNPLSPWRGLAPIAAAREGITIDLFAQAWSKAFLKSGARPDYAVIAPQGITQTEREEIESKLMQKFSGSDNWHRPMVLEEGVTDIRVFSFPPKDIEWLEQRKFSRDEVGGIFGVPDMIMGYGPEAYDTEEKIRSALLLFWTLTMGSLCGHRDNSLTHYFTRVRPMLNPGERIDTDLSDVGVLQEDLSPKIAQARDLFDMTYPPNAINERLGLGMPEVPWGNVGYVPMMLVPAGGAGGQGGGGAAELAMREFLMRCARQFGDGEGRSWLIEAAGGDWKKKETLTSAPEYGSAEHERLWKAFAAQLAPHEGKLKRQLKRDFQRQQSEVLRALRGDDGKAAQWAKGVERKQGEEIPYNADDLLDWRAEVVFFEENYVQFFEQAVADFGQAQLDGLGVAIDFDLLNPMVAQNIQAMTIQFAKDINATTQGQIADVLRQVLMEADEGGWGIPEIQAQIYERISAVFDVRKSDYETERIARTEMNKAASAGNLDGMRQSGVVERKAWLAALDGRTRPTHVDAHFRYRENPIALEAMFEVGQDTMAHPGGGRLPEENIFCRCTPIAIID